MLLNYDRTLARAHNVCIKGRWILGIILMSVI
jgi:hypothetical protein